MLLNAIGWFVPGRDQEHLELLRAQLFAVFAAIIAANAALFAVLHGLHHIPGEPYTIVWLLWGLCGASLAMLGLLKAGMPMPVLNSLLLVILQGGVLAIACLDGGLRSGAVFWLIAAPLASAFVGGPRFGWIAACISVVSGMVLHVIAAGGYVFPSALSETDAALHYLINFVCAAGFVGAVSALYEGPMVRHFHDLSMRLETINRDLRRELAERQRAQAQAEAASRAKDVLLANMSHEFRTPLTAILGFTEILSDEADPDARPLLESIDRGGRRLLNTLNGVLDLAWIESSETAMSLKPVNAQAVVGEIASRFLPTAVQRGLSFEVSGDDVLVQADPEALRRVTAAIIDNAIRFTERGSVVVSIHAEGEQAVVRVSDTGIGMRPDFLEQAMQPFRQASEGDSRTHEGVGVGLTVADRLLEMMGGMLSIESDPGTGTTVTLRLPALVADEAVSETEVVYA